MTNSKRLLRVFLCHASGDKPIVKELYNRLVDDGVDAWLDIEKLIPGQDWEIEIPKAVKTSDVVIVCLSSKSLTKEGYVQKEIKFALDIASEKPDGTIFIIPARLDYCEVPERLRKYHWVDLFSDDGHEKLTKALQARANDLGLVVKHKRKSIKPKVESYPNVIETAQENQQGSKESKIIILPQKTWYRKTYDFLVENWLISGLISTTPAWWYTFIEVFGKNFGLIENGTLSPIASKTLLFLFVISLTFTFLMTLANRYNERGLKSGQIILTVMLESVNAIKHAKLRRFTKYIDSHYGKQITNPFFEIIQPHDQIENVLENMRFALSQITDVKINDISISLLSKTGISPNWHWTSMINIESDLELKELISNPHTTIRQVIDRKADLIFYPDKRIGFNDGHYINGQRDLAYEGKGSILCKVISLHTNRNSIQSILSIATYGLQLCNTDDYSASQKIIDIILPVFERRIQLELASLYIKEVMSTPNNK